MSDPDSRETTAGGWAGTIVGKAKSVVGSLLGNDDLKREGNLQQAQAEAEGDADRAAAASELRREQAAVDEQRAAAAAERERLRIEIEAEEHEARIAKSTARRERDIALSANQQLAAIERREELQQRATNVTEEAALHRRSAQAAEAVRLEREAAAAEARAEAIDPEEK